jgi:hypothetical protein
MGQQHKLEDINTDGDCCFNHIIGLPTKEGVEKVIFDYEKTLYNALLDNESCNIRSHFQTQTSMGKESN